MSFNNSVIGGAAALIRAAIKSPNFVTGSAGWQISKDGSAEFNSLTIRGTFQGTNFVINSVGMFVYNGAPAKGTLILAIAETSGVDAFGNNYGQGFNVGVWSASTGNQLQHFGIDNNGKVYVANTAGLTVTYIDSDTGALLVYDSTGQALGHLIASLSPVAGTDVVGNPYPMGLNVTTGTISGTAISGSTFTAGDTIINSAGIFVYSSTPALGNLIASIAPVAGTDSFGNVYAAGVAVEQGGLVLYNQGSAPSPVAGASEFYSSSGGRPRYLAASGADLVLERSAVNMSHISMTTQTLPTAMSGALNYLANEAQVASEYEIEIDGIITQVTGGTGTVPKFNWAVAVDGSTLGGQFALGNVFLTQGNTYTFTLRGRIAIGSTGVAGTAHVATDGMFMIQGGAAVGNTQVTWPGGSNSGGPTKSFDTTVNHSITIVGAWDSTTMTGHKADTYRTKIVRRN